MRLAFIADIHANVHALQAVLDDLTLRGLVDRTYHLGDLVGGIARLEAMIGAVTGAPASVG